MALWGLDMIAASSLLLLSAGGGDITCRVAKAPQINVNPTSQSIVYDYSKTSAELNHMQSNTVSPYAPDADVTTGGLREDRPQTRIEVRWNVLEYPREELVCLSYNLIDVEIQLHPKIYIAKDFGADRACKAAILEHERKHVKIDRQVTNKYARLIGSALKRAIDDIGALGPYNKEDLPAMQKLMVEHVNRAAQSYDLQLEKEMRARQAEVDSLAEYERVSKLCDHVQ